MATAVLAAVIALGALAAGILIGRYYVPDDRRLKRTARHARSYMRAVNHLLGRDRDAAMEELKSVVKEDVYDVEPYFALGALFRSRGEHERAIRVHQAISVREEEKKEVKLRALYELGLDFRAAGMPRRATRAMEDCLAEDHRHSGALRALCGLYEEVGRYAEAATAWHRLEKLGAGRSPRQVHLLAAAAEEALAAEEQDEARRLLKEAERLERDAPHVQVVAAELASARGQHREATEALAAGLSRAPELAAYLVPRLRRAWRAQLGAEAASERSRGGSGDGEEAPEPESEETLDERAAERAARHIEQILDEVGRQPLLLLALAELRSHFDAQRALEDYRALALELPEVLPARMAAARLALASGDPEEIQSELRALCSGDGPLAFASEGIWRCGHCGRRDEAFFWRCATCRRWGEIRRDVGPEAQKPPPPQPRERRAAPRGLLGIQDEDHGDGIDRGGSLLSRVWRRVRPSGARARTK